VLKPIKVLDYYLLRFFLSSLIVISLGIGILIVAINMVEELQHFIDYETPIGDILMYYVYFSGWVVKSFLPVFVLLASLTSIGILARKNEILAMKASGISLYRIAAPLLIFTFLLSLGHFYYSEYIFPEGNKKRLELKEFTIKKRSAKSKQQVQNIYRQVNDNLFFVIKSYNVPGMRGNQIKIFRTEDGRLAELISADSILYSSRNWVLYDGVRRLFSDTTSSFVKFDSMSAPFIKDKPSDFEKPLGKPEDMGYEELKHYINVMKRTGGSYYPELVDLKFKISYPFSSFIVILLCVPIATNPKRGGIAVSFAIGAGIALVYFVCFKVTQSLGYSERLNPDVAAWLINLVFLVIGVVIMWKTKK
jgi:lipopolysaccharide export system permease protein